MMTDLSSGTLLFVRQSKTKSIAPWFSFDALPILPTVLIDTNSDAMFDMILSWCPSSVCSAFSQNLRPTRLVLSQTYLLSTHFVYAF